MRLQLPDARASAPALASRDGRRENCVGGRGEEILLGDASGFLSSFGVPVQFLGVYRY